jgi:hypothetical protein
MVHIIIFHHWQFVNTWDSDQVPVLTNLNPYPGPGRGIFIPTRDPVSEHWLTVNCYFPKRKPVYIEDILSVFNCIFRETWLSEGTVHFEIFSSNFVPD